MKHIVFAAILSVFALSAFACGGGSGDEEKRFEPSASTVKE